MPANLDLTKTYFLDLKLFDRNHKNVSNNFYVLSTEKDSLDVKKSNWYVTPQSNYADLTMLEKLPKVKLEKTETTNTSNGKTMMELKIKNPTSHLAFMVYLDLKKGNTDESVVPVFWDNNYFTLLPGEERTVSVWVHTDDLDGQKPVVKVSGWNVE